MLGAHGVQFVLHLHILGSINGELQSHVLQSLCDDDTAIESNIAALAVISAYSGSFALGGREVERGVVGLTGKLHIATFLDGEGLQGDDGQ